MAKKIRFVVTIKPDVLDPAGVAVKKVLNHKDLFKIDDVRIGKVVDISFIEDIETVDQTAMFTAIKDLLCNPIIEDCTFVKVGEQ